MKPTNWVGVGLLVLCVSCGKSLDRQVREAVRNFDRSGLSDSQIEVLRTYTVGNQAVAEVKIKTALRLSERDGRWTLEEIRIGQDRWEKAEHFLAILNEQRIQSTRRQLQMMAQAIRRYVEKEGKVPPAHDFQWLINLLTPSYLAEVVRLDAWANPFVYRRLSEESYELRSAGPDGKPETTDDLVERGGQ